MNVLWPMIEILELKRGEKLLFFINDKKGSFIFKKSNTSILLSFLLLCFKKET